MDVNGRLSEGNEQLRLAPTMAGLLAKIRPRSNGSPCFTGNLPNFGNKPARKSNEHEISKPKNTESYHIIMWL